MPKISIKDCSKNQQCVIPGYCCHHTKMMCLQTSSCLNSHELDSCQKDKECPTGCCDYMTKICTTNNSNCLYDGTVHNSCDANEDCPIQGECCNQNTHLCGFQNCMTKDGERANLSFCNADDQCASNCCDQDANKCTFNNNICINSTNGGLQPIEIGFLVLGFSVILLFFCAIIYVLCKRRKAKRDKQSYNHRNIDYLTNQISFDDNNDMHHHHHHHQQDHQGNVNYNHNADRNQRKKQWVEPYQKEQVGIEMSSDRPINDKFIKNQIE